MKVYHGSYMKITTVDLSRSEGHRDFGRGFYVTKFRMQAEEWAEKIAVKYGQSPCITEFNFFESAFTSWKYKVLRFAAYSDEWLDFIVKNRNPEFTGPMHDYDMVEGPVADDRVQRNIDAFLNGRLSREKFLAMLRFPHYETHQSCFCSTRSLLMLKPLDKNFDINFEIEEAGEKILEQIVSDYRFTSEQATDIFYSSNTFTQLADCTTKLYEKPWQEIYELLINELNLKI